MNDYPPIMTAAEACEKFAGFPGVQKAGGLNKASFIAGYEMAVSQIRAALNPLGEAQLCKVHGRFPCRECGTKHFAGCQCSFCRPTKN